MKNIWTNGCFDIVHIGHIKLLEYAKSLGDNLFVGIDSDSRVKKLKGYSRPINTEKNRKELLSSIKFVSGVFIFNNDNELENLIRDLQISTMVIGDDYQHKHVIGRKYCSDIIFFPKIQDISTSKLIMLQENT